MKKTSVKVRPRCPFCGENVGRPAWPTQRKLGEFALGQCQCGAVYTSDPTGFNVGAAMVDCLVYACHDNWDLAWELLPGEDYLTGRIENYDEQTHQVVESRNLDGRTVKGVLYFIRLQRGQEEIAGDQPARQSSAALPAVEPERDAKRVRLRASKAQVKTLVEAEDTDALVDLCFDDRRTLSFMQRLLYDPDDAKRWLIAHIIGKVCARFATRQPGAVSDLLHRLYESCADSAAANWGAVEAIGAIIAYRPDIFGGFTRYLLRFVGDPSMQLQVLWALGTIAEKRPDLIRQTPFYMLFDSLGHADPAVRGHALRLLGNIGASEVRTRLEKMLDDKVLIVVYEEGHAVTIAIAELAKRALARLNKEN